MIFYAICEDGFVSKITAKDYSGACYEFDNIASSVDGVSIIVEARLAKAISQSIIKLSKRVIYNDN